MESVRKVCSFIDDEHPGWCAGEEIGGEGAVVLMIAAVVSDCVAERPELTPAFSVGVPPAATIGDAMEPTDLVLKTV